jgi:hypothetical protein
LKNTGRRGGTKGIDLNIFSAWAKTRGKGVSVARRLFPGATTNDCVPARLGLGNLTSATIPAGNASTEIRIAVPTLPRTHWKSRWMITMCRQ